MTDEPNLLDQMLSQAAESKPADAERKAQKEAAQASVASWPTDVEALASLSSEHLAVFLEKVDPNVLVCLLGECSEALRRPVMGMLSGDSAQWMRSNLELWEPSTEARREECFSEVLKLARGLVRAGLIAPPDTAGSARSDERGQAKAQDAALAGTLADLVALSHAQGSDALKELLDHSPHPLLKSGLLLVLAGERELKLDAALDAHVAELMSTYRAELELVRQAVLSVARSESAEAFAARVGLHRDSSRDSSSE